MHPVHAEALSALEAGEGERAEALLRRHLDQEPGDAQGWSELARVLSRGGDLEGAVEVLERSLELEADQAAVLTRLGAVLQHLGRLEEACGVLERAVAVGPDHAEAWCNLGIVRLVQGDAASLERGEKALERALELEPEHGQALRALVLTRRRRGRHRQALELCDQVIASRPGCVVAHVCRGLTLRDRGCPEQALEAFQDAMRLQPERAELLGDVANCLHDLGRYREAIEAYDQVLALQSEAPLIQTNRGLCRLAHSDLQQGWDDYEARLSRTPFPLQCRPAGSPWRGEPLNGDTLLLMAEQGHGDTIQFIRYAPLLRHRCSTLALCLPDNLVSLVEASGLVDRIWTPSQAGAHPGPWMPLLSVCTRLGGSPRELGAPVPYLRVPEARISRWREVFGSGGAPLIALHWQGNPDVETGTAFGRSFPLELLAPLRRCAPLQLLALQKGPGAEQRFDCSFQASFHPCQDQVDATWDFLETAAILHCCDLLITSDSAIAHLAGALGLPVWLLLKQVPDWRWGLEGDRSPWYPSMRLFRQRERGDWPEVIERVRGELAQVLARRKDQG